MKEIAKSVRGDTDQKIYFSIHLDELQEFGNYAQQLIQRIGQYMCDPTDTPSPSSQHGQILFPIITTTSDRNCKTGVVTSYSNVIIRFPPLTLQDSFKFMATRLPEININNHNSNNNNIELFIIHNLSSPSWNIPDFPIINCLSSLEQILYICSMPV